MGKCLREMLGQGGGRREGVYADTLCSRSAPYNQVLSKCHRLVDELWCLAAIKTSPPAELAILLLCCLGTDRVLENIFISGTGATVLS